jgi:YaiO family outer membrane protein
MNRNKLPAILPLVLGVVFVLGLLSSGAAAQVDTLKMDPDRLFQIAREKAIAGQHEDARRLCRMIIARSPGYLDAKVLMGRTLAWDGKRSEARAVLQEVLRERPSYQDAIEALADVDLWDNEFQQALDVSNEGLDSSPLDVNLLLKKARALNGLGREAEALLVLLKAEEIDPSRGEVSSMIQSMKIAAGRTGVGISYAIDHYSDYYGDFRYVSFQLGRRTPFGSVFGRLNYSSRFGTQGLQVESELYPRLADGVYAYLNYGYSGNALFPKHRTGAEVYAALGGGFEGSIGLRNLYFNPTSSVTIYTGTIGYYVGNYWISFRPSIIPNDAGTSNSATVTVRRYFGDAETYLSLVAGAGFSADQRFIQSSTGFVGQQVFYLKSQTLGLGWQQNLGTAFLLLMTLDVANQEVSFEAGKYIVRYSFSSQLRVRF